MRHIDDAHQAEGHGEPEAHDQKDGPEADAVEEIAGQVAPGEEHFDAPDGGARGLLGLGVPVLLRHDPELSQARLGPRLAQELRRPRAHSGVRRGEAQPVQRFLDDAFDLPIRLPIQGLREHRDRGDVPRVPELEGGRLARLAIRAEDRQALEDALNQAEQPLFQSDGLLPLRGRDRLAAVVHDGLPRQILQGAVIGQDGEAPLPPVQAPVLERPQQGLHGRVADLPQSEDRRLLGSRRGELLGDRLKVRDAGPGGRCRDPGPGDPQENQQDERGDTDYCFSESHTRFPPTTSYVPLPPLLQSHARLA